MAYWAATQTEAHRERVAERFLKQFGFEVYLPRVCAGIASAAASASGNRTFPATASAGSNCNGTA